MSMISTLKTGYQRHYVDEAVQLAYKSNLLTVTRHFWEGDVHVHDQLLASRLVYNLYMIRIEDIISQCALE